MTDIFINSAPANINIYIKDMIVNAEFLFKILICFFGTF